MERASIKFEVDSSFINKKKVSYTIKNLERIFEKGHNFS